MKRVADHLRLFINLLQHEVPVAAFADGRAGQLRNAHLAVDRRVVAVVYGVILVGEHDPIAVVEIDDDLGQRRQRDGVGAQEHLVLADAKSQWAALARTDHQFLVARENNCQRKSAFEALQGRRRRILG